MPSGITQNNKLTVLVLTCLRYPFVISSFLLFASDADTFHVFILAHCALGILTVSSPAQPVQRSTNCASERETMEVIVCFGISRGHEDEGEGP